VTDHKRRRTILIVDDIPENVSVLAVPLAEDYEVLFALNGEDALWQVEQESVDLILLDVMMPDMDGYEVCQRLKLRESTQSIPVIFITAKDDVEDEEKGLAVGAVDYITKPFRLPIVKARVKTHLDLKAKTDLLMRLANVDGLTGIPNRRSFDIGLEKEWRRAARGPTRLSLLLLDIDHFKLYNDHYGHVQGDLCLKQVAACLAESVARAGDQVARYGGEEFAVILPSTDREGAHEVAFKILHGIRDLNLEHAASPTAACVTISVGIASALPDGSITQENLITSTDEALYMAKHRGRNQVSFSSFPVASS
jgi:diguanylate cyclase (GGDEF)-like protein